VSVPVSVLVPVGLIYGIWTATFIAPAEFGGVTAVSLFVFTNTTPVAGTPPTVTEALLRKLLPVMVMAVPPD